MLALVLLLQATPIPRDEMPAMLTLDPPVGLHVGEYGAPFTAPREAAARVGRKLFFDPILSSDRTVACASCHLPTHGFSSIEIAPAGVGGRRKGRNAPSLFNRALGRSFSWDGKAPSLAEQVLLPIEDKDEMSLALDDALARVRAEASYAPLLREAFGETFRREDLSESLTSFVSTLWIGDSPVDRFQAGKFPALTDDERAGLWLYESKGGCWRCHVGPNFTDELFHDTGIGAKDGEPEPGRFAITRASEDRGRFKTPTLRGLAMTAPYMHDGSLATLADVVAHYRRGGVPNSNLDPALHKLELDDVEAARLVAFLNALSRTSAP